MSPIKKEDRKRLIKMFTEGPPGLTEIQKKYYKVWKEFTDDLDIKERLLFYVYIEIRRMAKEYDILNDRYGEYLRLKQKYPINKTIFLKIFCSSDEFLWSDSPHLTEEDFFNIQKLAGPAYYDYKWDNAEYCIKIDNIDETLESIFERIDYFEMLFLKLQDEYKKISQPNLINLSPSTTEVIKQSRSKLKRLTSAEFTLYIYLKIKCDIEKPLSGRGKKVLDAIIELLKKYGYNFAPTTIRSRFYSIGSKSLQDPLKKELIKSLIKKIKANKKLAKEFPFLYASKLIGEQEVE